jgi:RNA polymerase sigma factor (TIGR02999 family)
VPDDPQEPSDITHLLHRWQSGEPEAFDSVMVWAHQRMMAIASGFLAFERLSTEPAALVNEAYLRLRRVGRMEWQDRQHFFSVAARELRRVLIDQARLRCAQKRQGSRQRVPLSDDLRWIDVRGQEMLDLDRALDALEEFDSEKARMVELRYIMGCTVPEICALRDTSSATVERTLRFARTWLYNRLNPEDGGAKP